MQQPKQDKAHFRKTLILFIFNFFYDHPALMVTPAILSDCFNAFEEKEDVIIEVG